jgi:tetratricopeptide (TPR) repeat protein
MGSKGEALWALFDLGRWDELLRISDELLAWERLHGRGYYGVMGLSHKALVLVRRGAVDEARSLSDEPLPRARRIEDPQILAPALITTALIEQARGRATKAVALVEELAATTRDPFKANQVTDAVRICVAAGDRDLARRLLEETPRAMARHRHARVTADAAISEAGGDLENAAQHYAEAVGRWDQYGFALEHALALLGDPGDAIRELQQATKIFMDLRVNGLALESNSLMSEIA